MTRDALLQQFEIFRKGGPNRDVVPLRNAAIQHVKSGTVSRADCGPLFGVLWFSSERRFITRGIICLYRWVTPSAAFWNDFHMCIWMLSESQDAALDLYEHVQKAIRKGRTFQASSAQWMISSVCEQEPEFKRQWNLCIAQHGEVFNS